MDSEDVKRREVIWAKDWQKEFNFGQAQSVTFWEINPDSGLHGKWQGPGE